MNYLDNIDEIKKRILASANPQNREIFEKEFLYASLTLKRIKKYYDFGNKKILDIGSSYGQYLINFSSNSLGVECRPEAVAFSKNLGLRTISMNVEDSLLDINEKFELISCRQVLDHMVSPHKFLIDAHSLLKPKGEVLICIDNIHFFGGFKLPLEHLYGFCYESLKICLEKSGFKIKKFFTILSAKPLWLEWTFNKSKFLLKRCQDIYAVGEKIDNFEYPSKRIDAFTPSWLKIKNSEPA